MILVVGATGTLGGRITRGLLEQGKEVRILVRDPSPSVERRPLAWQRMPIPWWRPARIWSSAISPIPPLSSRRAPALTR